MTPEETPETCLINADETQNDEHAGVFALVRAWEATAQRRQEEKVALMRLVSQMERFIMEHCSWEQNGIAAHQARKAVREQMKQVMDMVRYGSPVIPMQPTEQSKAQEEN